MKAIRLIIFLSTCLLILVHESHAAWVIEKDDRVYIEDQTGERWDVTQARELGFIPHRFQYGIGKNAFTPLVDNDLTDSHPAKSDSTRVIGVSIEGDAHAYDVRSLVRHEIANTTLGGKPIAAGYWPLVDLAAVYSRTLNGKTLTLAPSGWTYKNTFVLYDKETMSLWYPERNGLRGIAGEHFQKFLPQLKSSDTEWGDWVEEHPKTKVIK